MERWEKEMNRDLETNKELINWVAEVIKGVAGDLQKFLAEGNIAMAIICAIDIKGRGDKIGELLTAIDPHSALDILINREVQRPIPTLEDSKVNEEMASFRKRLGLDD